LINGSAAGWLTAALSWYCWQSKRRTKIPIRVNHSQQRTKEDLLVQDMENSYLNLDPLQADPMQPLHGSSMTYRIAVGPHQGKKVFTLQTVLPRDDDDRFRPVAKANGFSLHAGVATGARQRQKLERICR
jgi:hypothetical protein